MGRSEGQRSRSSATAALASPTTCGVTAPRTSWDSPEPTGESPEAEWGFEPELRGDVERIAQERGYRVRRIVFDEPEQVSPLVADLYHWWYAQRRIIARRLLVECFLMMEPFWTLRTASIPFWLTFK